MVKVDKFIQDSIQKIKKDIKGRAIIALSGGSIAQSAQSCAPGDRDY